MAGQQQFQLRNGTMELQLSIDSESGTGVKASAVGRKGQEGSPESVERKVQVPFQLRLSPPPSPPLGTLGRLVNPLFLARMGPRGQQISVAASEARHPLAAILHTHSDPRVHGGYPPFS